MITADDLQKLALSSRVALLLKHDSSCATEYTGVCNCWFFDVANQLTQLMELEIKKSVKAKESNPT